MLAAPHIRPNDDHAPTAIDHGQRLLREVYLTLTANPTRWARTLMPVTYDEHGGFFDHVPPLAIRTESPDPVLHPYQPFDSTGIRVPAFVISPFVRPGSVVHDKLEHTSILTLLAEWFADKYNQPATPYSAAVAARQQQGLGVLSAALTPNPDNVNVPAPQLAPEGVPTPAARAFTAAVQDMYRQDPGAARQAFPQLWWSGQATP